MLLEARLPHRQANFHGTPKPTARDQLLLYALGTFDIQRPTLDFGNEQVVPDPLALVPVPSAHPMRGGG